MNEVREFTELLKGCRPVKDADGNIVVQSILNMQLVCLTTDSEYSLDSRFANPMISVVASNRSYGQMSFSNQDRKETILPTQMAVITKQSAQNHGMVKAGYIGAGDSVTFHDAGCVQGSQGGYFNSTQEYRILPLSIREMVFEAMENGEGYSRIYPAIRKLGEITRSDTAEYVDRYFSKYDKKLEQFIAHFERPSNLIGMVVLIDGEIMAIDKFPSFTYAEQVWRMMIRDCYGSLAIISELKNTQREQVFTNNFNTLRGSGRELVAMMEEALRMTKEGMTRTVRDRIQELLEVSFEAIPDTEGNPSHTSMKPKSFLLKNEGYVGQVITESEYNHLVSVVRKDKFNPNALREVNALRQKARKQDRFRI